MKTLHAPFILALVSAMCLPSYAQDSFNKDKTVRIVVGFAAVGGFDTYSRTLARHRGKHIPGNPTIIVDNMPGAAQRD